MSAAEEKLKEDFYSEEFVAEYLGYSIPVLRSLHSQGKDLPTRRRIGKRALYPRAEFDAWLARKNEPETRPVA